MRHYFYTILAIQFFAIFNVFESVAAKDIATESWKQEDQDIGVIRRHVCQESNRPAMMDSYFQDMDRKEKKRIIRKERNQLRKKIIRFAQDFPEKSPSAEKIINNMSSINIEHYPIITQRFFEANNFEISEKEWIGFCESSFGRTRDHDFRSILAIGSYSTFFAAAAVSASFPPALLAVPIAMQITRFGLGIRETMQNSIVLKDFSHNPEKAVFWNNFKIVSELAMMGAYGFGMPAVYGQMKEAGGLIPFITPQKAGFYTFLYGNVMSSVIYAIKLIEHGQNPLKTPSYYTDTIANIVAYGAIGRMVGTAESYEFFARFIPSAVILFAVMDDYMNQIAKRFDPKKMRDKHSQKYFTWWASTITPVNVMIDGMTTVAIEKMVPGGLGLGVALNVEKFVRYFLYFSICYRTGAIVVGEEADFWPTVWSEFKKWETYDPAKQIEVVKSAFEEWKNSMGQN